MPSRRRVLRAAFAGTVGLLSGCASPAARRRSTTGQGSTPTTQSPDSTTGRAGTTTARADDPTDRARAFVAALDRGDFEAAAAAFVDGPRRLPPSRLQRFWMGLTAQLGAYREVANAGRTTNGDREVVELTLALADGRQRARVALVEEGIVDLSFPASYAPPDYVDTAAFEERELSLGGDCELPAALCLPDGDRPVPGVVLVHGSGPHDRDQSIGPNRPFRDLAWGLATRGVATLRYEKRTHGCPLAPAERTVETVVVADAREAASVLADHDRVGPVAVVGHSLGATLAPQIASGADADGVAMLAAAARPLSTLIREQVEYITALDGEITDSEALARERVEGELERIETGDYGDGEVLLGFSGTFWRSFREYDPVEVARSFDGPEAFLQGARDYQVSPERDFGQFRRALGDRGDATFRRYDGLDHLFMPGHGPSLPEEYRFPDNVAKEVVADLAAWLGGLDGSAARRG